ncbi:hypothetical protein IQ266_04405 [filamentous cyanobacterium LEGE 11480]|uniref:Uncharacterized protein n=2 Tax=Romeriopsis TaxID=2992131 RepID=A0A928VJQ9_9CYAN|nr:hypothetical protein [Romeriopsis navalis LEGE 11480]
MPQASAVTVNPTGVNVKTFGATTVFLTFRGLNNQTAAEAFWCGDINADNSCVAGTIFGRLPLRSDLSRLSGQNNFTDIMTIPASVSRRAYQDALRGNRSDFFYVRRFVNPTTGQSEFVAVTCRLAGGGARVPLSLTNVQLKFADGQPVPAITTGESLPKFGAEIRFNGTGRLKGRWEVVLPGDPLPTREDLLTEATLPIEQRALQRRYTQLERFDTFLQPTGKFFLPGPDPSRFPKGSVGAHLILLRIEATDDREGNSDIGTPNQGRAISNGGVAGFPMPVLRYFITPSQPKPLLLEPRQGQTVISPVKFVWQGISGVGGYRLMVKNTDKMVLSALLEPDKTQYTAPPWLQEQAGNSLTWSIQALKADGAILQESTVGSFRIK